MRRNAWWAFWTVWPQHPSHRGKLCTEFSLILDKKPKDKACVRVLMYGSPVRYIEQEKQIHSATKMRDEDRNQQAFSFTEPQLAHCPLLQRKYIRQNQLCKLKTSPLLKGVVCLSLREQFDHKNVFQIRHKTVCGHKKEYSINKDSITWLKKRTMYLLQDKGGVISIFLLLSTNPVKRRKLTMC